MPLENERRPEVQPDPPPAAPEPDAGGRGEPAQPEILPVTRASDAQRGAVAERLRDAFADGRLDEEEFGVRIHAALSARTTQDLEHLLDDLGRPSESLDAVTSSAPATETASARAGRSHTWTIAIMSGSERKGRWRVPEETTALSIMGGASLDLRTATLTSPITTITAIAIMGGTEVLVPPGVRVEVSGFGLMGGIDDRVQDEDLPSTAPLVRIRWFALMGGVAVYTKRPGKKDRTHPKAIE